MPKCHFVGQIIRMLLFEAKKAVNLSTRRKFYLLISFFLILALTSFLRVEWAVSCPEESGWSIWLFHSLSDFWKIV